MDCFKSDFRYAAEYFVQDRLDREGKPVKYKYSLKHIRHVHEFMELMNALTTSREFGRMYQVRLFQDVPGTFLAANPKAEICAFKDGKWLRVAGELVNDDNHEVKVAMLEKMPSLKGMYSADDDNMQMLYFKNATATFSSFTEAPETVAF